ncbi:DUF1778 domain-containing protein [Sphingomonas lycopersici]|uniref:DUF1778 domain-containing protein n=1 Tax=Sphingomonas lycopersici TaxID=2951807 RepID=A0AA41Z8S4_9SPHN|nr:DUF1778 domain-containing protein [Sphingomonas lycopersici]MCW6536047.1 DUF1778 domain-containing protein [Sphingomonas lycopersici]
MHAFEDRTAAIAERSTARMNFRTKPHVKEAIQRAAALSGVDDSVFAMNAAYKAALDVIEAQERMVLRGEDAAALLDALDNPPPPTDALRAAFAQYRERYLSN